ncbi:hypothetical protein ZWY2020_041062, partial [Hordeum vulgare]
KNAAGAGTKVRSPTTGKRLDVERTISKPRRIIGGSENAPNSYQILPLPPSVARRTNPQLASTSHGPRQSVLWPSSPGLPRAQLRIRPMAEGEHLLGTKSLGRYFPSLDNQLSLRRFQSTQKTRSHAGKSVSGASVDANGKFVVKVEKRAVDFVDYINVNYVLVATGSSQQGYSFAAQHGHSIIPTVPSLLTFKIADKRLADLSGVTFTRVKAKLMLDGIQKSAPELTQLMVDFIPDIHTEDVKRVLFQHKDKNAKSKVNNSFPKEFGLVKRFWGFLLEQESIDGDMHWATVPKNHLNATALRLKQWMFEVVGKGHFKDEFVTAGGVPLSKISLSTMESKKQPNLFFAGEVLNVDGSPAGFNFQNAWTGGYIAGTSIGTLASTSILKEEQAYLQLQGS